jgi:AmpD protein
VKRVVWRDGWWSRARRVRSPNVGARPAGADVTLAIVHSISLPPGEYGGDAVERLFTNRLDAGVHPYYAQLEGLQVSAHFFIRRDGAIVQFASCDERAWHAGTSRWDGRDNCNDWSIGIELEGLEGGCFEPAQYRALIRLLRALRWATSMWRPGASAIRARASTGGASIAPSHAWRRNAPPEFSGAETRAAPSGKSPNRLHYP